MPIGGGYAVAGAVLRWRLHVIVTSPVVGHGGAVLHVRDCSDTALLLVSVGVEVVVKVEEVIGVIVVSVLFFILAPHVSFLVGFGCLQHPVMLQASI